MYRYAKYTFDTLIALAGIAALSPILALVFVMIRIGLGAPVIFKQQRPGLHGRPYLMYKFRTMQNASGKEGNPLPDEQRLTALGSFLRKTSLDELPELFNVLQGNMSLVGPRPLLMEYLPRYTREQARRHEVKPGITGWAQVNGRNAISWEKKFELDVWYVDNRSIMLDLKILWMTLIRVVKREGVNQEGHVTMEKFTGTRASHEKQV
jgi:sugar transferase EpsL